MNARERVRCALTCGIPDRIPVALAFWEEPLPAAPPGGRPGAPPRQFKLDVRFAEFKAPAGQEGFVEYLRSLPRDVHVGSLGQLKTYHEWNYHPEAAPAGSPLNAAQTIDDLERYVFPDLRDPSRYAGLAAQVAGWHAQGYAVAGSPPHLGGELFEMAYRLRGFQDFLSDLKLRKPLAHYLLDQLSALTVHSALVLAEAGIDVLLLDDDVAMPTDLIIGTDTWREFFKPRLAEIIRLARQVAPELLVFYHSDGNFTRLIRDLVDIGVNVINPVQPDCMDGQTIKAEFGNRLALWGTVGSALLWDRGTPEQVRAEVKRRCETLGPAGLLLAPAYDVDFAPAGNLIAFLEAAEEYGAPAS
jgi:uroporphyrinogen decarboxylase